MIGAMVSTWAIVCLQVLVLPQGSVASQVRVATKVLPQPRFVTVLKIVIATGPQPLVPEVGLSKVKLPALHSLVLLEKQVMIGAMVSTWAIVCLQVLVLPQGSVASQVRVATKVLPQPRFVTVLKIVIATGPQPLVPEVGLSKVKLPALHSLVLLEKQVMIGAMVSTWAIVWLHVLVLPQGSVASQVRVATNVLPQPRFVTVPKIVIATGPQPLVPEVGLSKVRLPALHSLVLLG